MPRGAPLPEYAAAAAEKLRGRVRDLEKQLQQAQQKVAGAATDDLLAGATKIGGISVAAARAPQGLNANALRELADKLSDKLNGVVVLAGCNACNSYDVSICFYNNRK